MCKVIFVKIHGVFGAGTQRKDMNRMFIQLELANNRLGGQEALHGPLALLGRLAVEADAGEALEVARLHAAPADDGCWPGLGAAAGAGPVAPTQAPQKPAIRGRRPT